MYLNISALNYLPVGHPVMGAMQTNWITKDIPMIAEDEDDLPGVICRELKIGGSTKGFLHILQFNRSFREEDNYIITMLGNLLSILLWKDPKYLKPEKNEEISRFLRDILDNKGGDEAELNRRQKAVGLHCDKYLYIAVIVNGKPSKGARISYLKLIDDMQQKMPGSYGFLYRDSAVFLMSSKDEGTDAETLMEPIWELLENNGLHVGVSNQFESVAELREYCYQAVKAMELGSMMMKDGFVFLYRDYAVYHMIEASMPHGGEKNFCMPELARLRDYCQKNGQELFHTLSVYLDCGLNKTMTAKRLYAHVNTVKYRLGQIESIMGIDLSDSRYTMQLYLSMKIIEYLEHKERPDISKEYEAEA